MCIVYEGVSGGTLRTVECFIWELKCFIINIVGVEENFEGF